MLIKSKLVKDNLLVILNVHSTYNNTIVNISKLDNKTIFCASSGFINIKGSKRSSLYAAQKLGNILGKKLCSAGFRYVLIKIKGFGNGRYSCIKGFNATGLKILNVLDKTCIPFNGCRSSNKRRI